jgi:hypothetical protein
MQGFEVIKNYNNTKLIYLDKSTPNDFKDINDWMPGGTLRNSATNGGNLFSPTSITGSIDKPTYDLGYRLVSGTALTWLNTGVTNLNNTLSGKSLLRLNQTSKMTTYVTYKVDITVTNLKINKEVSDSIHFQDLELGDDSIDIFDYYAKYGDSSYSLTDFNRVLGKDYIYDSTFSNSRDSTDGGVSVQGTATNNQDTHDYSREDLSIAMNNSFDITNKSPINIAVTISDLARNKDMTFKDIAVAATIGKVKSLAVDTTAKAMAKALGITSNTNTVAIALGVMGIAATLTELAEIALGLDNSFGFGGSFIGTDPNTGKAHFSEPIGLVEGLTRSVQESLGISGTFGDVDFGTATNTDGVTRGGMAGAPTDDTSRSTSSIGNAIAAALGIDNVGNHTTSIADLNADFDPSFGLGNATNTGPTATQDNDATSPSAANGTGNAADNDGGGPGDPGDPGDGGDASPGACGCSSCGCSS